MLLVPADSFIRVEERYFIDRITHYSYVHFSKSMTFNKNINPISTLSILGFNWPDQKQHSNIYSISQ